VLDEEIVIRRGGQQALFDGLVRNDAAVGENMPDAQAAGGQFWSDQQAAVAVERLALGTPEGHAEALPRLVDMLDACAGGGGPRPGIMDGTAVAAERWVARPPAERIAHRHVGDADPLELAAQLASGKPWIKPGEGMRPHVGDGGNFCVAEEAGEA